MGHVEGFALWLAVASPLAAQPIDAGQPVSALPATPAVTSGASLVSAATSGAAVVPAVTSGRADENAVRQAGDAFGTSIGREVIGLYNQMSVRGFSPVAAGNVRIDGLYFDPVIVPTSRPGPIDDHPRRAERARQPVSGADRDRRFRFSPPRRCGGRQRAARARRLGHHQCRTRCRAAGGGNAQPGARRVGALRKRARRHARPQARRLADRALDPGTGADADALCQRHPHPARRSSRHLPDRHRSAAASHCRAASASGRTGCTAPTARSISASSATGRSARRGCCAPGCSDRRGSSTINRRTLSATCAPMAAAASSSSPIRSSILPRSAAKCG